MAEEQATSAGAPVATMRKTRFVCISDTHNASPGGAFKLPKGDVLLHAGDMTNQGSFAELQKTVKWIEEADFEAKIIIAGNHDITLDADFYSQYGLYFHNQEPQDSAKCIRLLEQSSSILWLRHEAATVKLSSPDGPHTTFKIFGSPYSPAKGMWAFGYGLEEAENIWDRIPLDSDVVMTHTPPHYHCDESRDRRAAGCEELRKALWRVRPRLAVCGHVHEGRGAEVVRWDLDHSNIKYKEAGVERWEDPGRGNKKMSLVDASSKGRWAVRNDGSRGALNDLNKSPLPEFHRPATSSPVDVPLSFSSQASTERPVKPDVSDTTTSLSGVCSESLSSATKGQGGMPPSQRCDLEALSGRLGRKDTCVVNAAIMASSWPHGPGGKKFNKPIVVDIDLLVWNT